MAHILIAPAGTRDTFVILAHLIAQAGRQTAAKYEAMLQRLYLRLSDHPAIGAPRPALGRNIRIGIVTPYVVIYRHTKNTDTVTISELSMAGGG